MTTPDHAVTRCHRCALGHDRRREPLSISADASTSRSIEATCLIQLGARAGLVCQLTGLRKATVMRLFRALNGVSSPPGQAPFTDTWYLKNDRRMLHAALVWRLHQHFEPSLRTPARVLIDVYESYRGIVHEPLLDITRTAFVPRLVTMTVWQERACDYCQLTFLAPLGGNDILCPGCRLYCRRCGRRRLVSVRCDATVRCQRNGSRRGRAR